MLADIRGTILVAFQYLPLVLICFVGFLAMGLGNLGLFILFMGHALVVPGLTEAFHAGLTDPKWTKTGDGGSLIPDTGATSHSMPSYWMAHMSFFMGYLVTNAGSIYGIKSTGPPSWRIDSRKSKALTVLVTTFALWFGMVLLRWRFMGVEDYQSILLATLVFGGAGAILYSIAAACGAKATDVFAITTQMVPELSPQKAKPITCVYDPVAPTTR